jgi:hypothetical protein
MKVIVNNDCIQFEFGKLLILKSELLETEQIASNIDV